MLLDRRAQLFGLLFAAACTTTQDCTTAGCVDGIRVFAPRGVADPSAGTVTLCIDDDCDEVRFGTGQDVIDRTRDVDDGDEVTAVLEMPGGQRFEAQAVVDEFRPNGPDCGPVCDTAELELAPLSGG